VPLRILGKKRNNGGLFRRLIYLVKGKAKETGDRVVQIRVNEGT